MFCLACRKVYSRKLQLFDAREKIGLIESARVANQRILIPADEIDFIIMTRVNIIVQIKPLSGFHDLHRIAEIDHKDRIRISPEAAFYGQQTVLRIVMWDDPDDSLLKPRFVRFVRLLRNIVNALHRRQIQHTVSVEILKIQEIRFAVCVVIDGRFAWTSTGKFPLKYQFIFVVQSADQPGIQIAIRLAGQLTFISRAVASNQVFIAGTILVRRF